MADLKEELEPLFDYKRVQPNFVSLDDDGTDDSQHISKRRKTSKPMVHQIRDNDYSDYADDVKVVENGNGVAKDEEDWLLPPPKLSKIEVEKRLNEDATIKELRLKKQELLSLVRSAANVIKAVEEPVRRESENSLHNAHEGDVEQVVKPPPSDRAKIVISVQDKEERKQFRVYKDDKLERLFKAYAEKNNINLQRLIFMFDGDKINMEATPNSLGMEDEDIIEVHTKKC